MTTKKPKWEPYSLCPLGADYCARVVAKLIKAKVPFKVTPRPSASGDRWQIEVDAHHDRQLRRAADAAYGPPVRI